MVAINAGIISKVLKKFWDSLKTSFEKEGYEIKDIKEKDNGVRVITFWVNDSKNSIDATCTPVNYDELTSDDDVSTDNLDVSRNLLESGIIYDIKFTTKGQSPIVVKNVKSDELIAKCKEVAEKWFGSSDVATVAGSQRITATLFKDVTASKQITIDLVAVEANYRPQNVLADINELLDSPEFVDNLVDSEPTTVDIEVVPEGYEYDIVNRLITSQEHSLVEIMKALWSTYIDALYLSYYMVGSGAPADAKSSCEDARWMAQSQYDKLAEICIEQGIAVPHPSNITEPGCTLCDLDVDGRMLHMFNRVTDVIAAIDLYYCNFEKDVQGLLESWLRGWKNLAYYRMREVPELSSLLQLSEFSELD